MKIEKVFDGQAADGQSSTVERTKLDAAREGASEEPKIGIALTGGLDGGTVKLQYSPDGGTTWVDVSGASWTASEQLVDVDAVPGEYRLDLSGTAGGAANLTAWLIY